MARAAKKKVVKKVPRKPKEKVPAALVVPKLKGPTPKGMVRIQVPDTSAVIAFAVTAKKEVEEAVDYVKAAVVSTVDNYKAIARMLYTIAQRHDIVQAKRKEWTAGLRAILDDINATLLPAEKGLKELEQELKLKMGNFVAERHMHHLAGTLPPGEVVAPPVETASVTLEWDGEVVDSKAVPAQYLMQVVNVEALRAATRAANGDPKIPGWRAQLVANVTTDRK